MRKQCSKCPWKVSTDPYDIPNGYDVSKHAGLESTIAEPHSIHLMSSGLNIFTCHETDDLPCVGWMINQLGPGNNLLLRLAVINGKIDADVRTSGPQHACFQETLPCQD